jgi:hypothetical protein
MNTYMYIYMYMYIYDTPNDDYKSFLPDLFNAFFAYMCVINTITYTYIYVYKYKYIYIYIMNINLYTQIILMQLLPTNINI